MIEKDIIIGETYNGKLYSEIVSFRILKKEGGFFGTYYVCEYLSKSYGVTSLKVADVRPDDLYYKLEK